LLQKLSEKIREFLRLAEECKRLSKTALTPSAIKDYLDMEQRWLNLAPAATSFQSDCQTSPSPSGGRNEAQP